MGRVLFSGMVILGGLIAIASWGPLHNLFDDHPDSPASTYLFLGGLFLLLGLSFVVVGVRGLRRQSTHNIGG